jgi:hypothetical protein
MEQTAMSFIVACKMFFGFKEGQKPSEFADEVRALTEQDKADIKAEFTKNGIVIKE